MVQHSGWVRQIVTVLALMTGFAPVASLAANDELSIEYPYTIFPPYIIKDADNNLAGWHGNLAHVLFKKAGIKARIYDAPFVRTLQMHKDGQVNVMQYADMGLGLTPDQFYFPVPNVTLEVTVFSKGDVSPDAVTIEKIGAKRFALMRSWPLGKYAALSNSPNANPVNDPSNAIKMLLSDRVDAVVMLRSPYDVMKTKGLISAADAQQIKLRTVDKVIANSFAVPKNVKDSDKFNAALTKAYRDLIRQGKIDEACTCLKGEH